MVKPKQKQPSVTALSPKQLWVWSMRRKHEELDVLHRLLFCWGNSTGRALHCRDHGASGISREQECDPEHRAVRQAASSSSSKAIKYMANRSLTNCPNPTISIQHLKLPELKVEIFKATCLDTEQKKRCEEEGRIKTHLQLCRGRTQV